MDIFQTGSGTSTHMNANEVIGHMGGAAELAHRVPLNAIFHI